MRLLRVALLAALGGFSAGCGNDEDTPAGTQQQATDIPATPAPTPAPTEIANPETVQIDDGLTYKIILPGTGNDTVDEGDEPVMELAIQKPGGEEIWSGRFQFTVGVGQAVPALDQGVRGMKTGEHRRIDASHLFTSTRTGAIALPDAQDLTFDVKLLEIAMPPEQTTPADNE